MIVILHGTCYNQNSCFEYQVENTKKGKVIMMEVRELLDLYSKEEHSGFLEEEISQAEKYIGVALPQIYRDFLKNYGKDKINSSCHRLLVPEEISTSYQAIEEELEYDWKEDFEEAVEEGTQEDYKDNEYFALWQLPKEEWHTITENYVLLWVENQGIWYAAYLLRDLKEGKENPPIYVSTNDDFITFEKCKDTLEEFLLAMYTEW